MSSKLPFELRKSKFLIWQKHSFKYYWLSFILLSSHFVIYNRNTFTNGCRLLKQETFLDALIDESHICTIIQKKKSNKIRNDAFSKVKMQMLWNVLWRGMQAHTHPNMVTNKQIYDFPCGLIHLKTADEIVFALLMWHYLARHLVRTHIYCEQRKKEEKITRNRVRCGSIFIGHYH